MDGPKKIIYTSLKTLGLKLKPYKNIMTELHANICLIRKTGRITVPTLVCKSKRKNPSDIWIRRIGKLMGNRNSNKLRYLGL